jgi:hypothetical protein
MEGAFSSEEAAAMRDVVWRALAAVGIRRDDPSTWRKERPDHLQHLKSDPVFRAVGSNLTVAAIDEVLAGQPWRRPLDWGAFFLVFPTARPWNVPADGWHIDAGYTGRLSPPKGTKVHAMFGDVAPPAGGMNIISGSHRLVQRWFLEYPARQGRAELSCGRRCTGVRTCGTVAPPAMPNPASNGSTNTLRRSMAPRFKYWKTLRRRAMSSSCIRCCSTLRPRHISGARRACC